MYDADDGKTSAADLMGIVIVPVADLIDLPKKEHKLTNSADEKRNRKLKMNGSSCIFKIEVSNTRFYLRIFAS